MKSFKDTEGREWNISLTINSAKRVRDALDVNLLELEIGDPPLLTRLGTDIMLLCDVIFVLVKPQADKADVTDEQFGEALGGDAIRDAQNALYEELVLFFQSLPGTKHMAKAIQTQRQMIDVAVTQIETQIEGLDLEAEVKKALGKASMKSQAPAELIPGP